LKSTKGHPSGLECSKEEQVESLDGQKYKSPDSGTGATPLNDKQTIDGCLGLR